MHPIFRRVLILLVVLSVGGVALPSAYAASKAPVMPMINTQHPVTKKQPAWMQYTPLPVPLLERTIQAQYPGSRITPAMLRQIAVAAKKENINELALLGILGADQDMLDTQLLRSTGSAHVAWVLQNPFNYGVWPGSPYQHNIGVYRSALGAAATMAAFLNSRHTSGSSPTLSGVLVPFSGVWVYGNAAKPDKAFAEQMQTVIIRLVAHLPQERAYFKNFK